MFYTEREERFHASTHAAGALLAALGAVYLILGAVATGDPWRVVSFAVYGCTLVLLYTASALYHGTRGSVRKARLRVLDHSAIYLLIAGSYTPFLLLRLRGPFGWTLFGLVWGVALAGVIYKLTLMDRFPRLSTATYLAMSWLSLAAIVPLFGQIGTVTSVWLVAGGVIYTSGALFFHHSRTPYAHVVWHMFVLGGSGCHFVAIAGL